MSSEALSLCDLESEPFSLETTSTQGFPLSSYFQQLERTFSNLLMSGLCSQKRNVSAEFEALIETGNELGFRFLSSQIAALKSQTEDEALSPERLAQKCLDIVVLADILRSCRHR